MVPHGNGVSEVPQNRCEIEPMVKKSEIFDAKANINVSCYEDTATVKPYLFDLIKFSALNVLILYYLLHPSQ